MIRLHRRRLSNDAASRRIVLLGGLLAASGLALNPNTTIAAHAQGANGSSGRPSTSSQRVSFVKTKDGTEIYYKDWGKGAPVVFS